MRLPSAKSVAGPLLILFAVGAVALGLQRQAAKDAAAHAAQTARTVQISETAQVSETVETSEAEETAFAESPAAAIRSQPVTVYYFHGDTRCKTCLAIESQTAHVIRARFAPELEDEALRFEIVNYDTPSNAHYLQDYDLSFGSVVVQGVGEDRSWENLAEVWTLIHGEPAAFEAYIVAHVRRMLEPAG